MQESQATRLTKQLRRYDYRGKRGTKTIWAPTGRFVVQALIPVISKSLEKAVIGVMARKDKRSRAEWVPLSRVWSTQHHLRIRSLLYQLRQYEHSQKGYYRSTSGRVVVKRETDLPTMFGFKGKFILWNGNHRTSAGLLLGRSRIRAKVYRLPKRKKPR